LRRDKAGTYTPEASRLFLGIKLVNNRTRDTGATVHHGDGTTSVFAINFSFPNSAAIEVVVRDDATKAEVVQAPGREYTVTGGGSKAGQIKMKEPPASGKTVIIRSKTAGATALPSVSPTMMMGAAAAGVVVVGLALWFLVFSEGPAAPPSDTPSSLMQVTADDVTLGSPTAPITMIEYASLGCPHCAEFAEHVLPQIKANYIDKGLVHYVLRDYPHTNAALSASMLASCVPKETRLDFSEMLFRSQPLWDAPGANVKEGLVTVARRAGMTRERVEQCLTNDAKMQEIRAAQDRAGTELNFNSIPTFFINGRMRGPGNYEDFDALFQGILTQLGVKPPQAPPPATDATATPDPSAAQNNPTPPESPEPESDTTPPSP
jgi:protein-disulfide isomerase